MNKTLAHVLSIVGHPLLMLTYALLLLLALDPYSFSVRSVTDKPAVLLLISVFSTTFLLPGLGVMLMKLLGFVKSLELYDQQERTGPYILTGVFYLWLYKNLASGGHTPELYVKFVLGATISLFFAFFVNIFTKISVHAAGMGGLVTMLLLIKDGDVALNLPLFGSVLQLSLIALLAIAVIFAGLVGAARLALGAHAPPDLYRGYAAGFVSVMLANLV